MGRAPCCDKNGLKRGPWATEEDQKLVDYIRKNGCANWRTLPKNAGLQRCGKSCRLRWTNYLRPDIKRGKFSFDEEEAIIRLHSVLGNKWSAIAARLPGRTDNEIKNYWNTHISKRLLRMGIDPVTHRPRLDLLNLNLSAAIMNSSSSLWPISQQPHQMFFSGLLGMPQQPLINPQLLTTSFLSSQSCLHHDNNFTVQNPNQIPPSLAQPFQVQTLIQDSTIDQAAPWDHDQAHKLITRNDIPVELGSEMIAFGQVDDQWQHSSGSTILSTPTDDDYASLSNYGYYGSGHSVMDPNSSSETTLTFQSNSSSNFRFHSATLSNMSATPSPSPLQSNSTYNNVYGSGGGSSSCGEDERESYCSNMMNLEFQIPEIMDAVDDVM